MDYLFRLPKPSSEERYEGGLRMGATIEKFSTCKSTCFFKTVIDPGCFREPHWHGNADEVGFCLKGKVLIIFHNAGSHDEKFIVQDHEAFFIPQGAIHSIENIGAEQAELLLNFSHELPTTFELSSVFCQLPKEIMTALWSPRPLHDPKNKTVRNAAVLAKLTQATRADEIKNEKTAFCYKIGKSVPFFEGEGGNLKSASAREWPVLKNQSVYSLLLKQNGVREPHWHSDAIELGYVAQGHGKLMITQPSGEVVHINLEPDSIYYIPQGYPHTIENRGSEDFHLVVFFSHPMPTTTSLAHSMKGFPRGQLSGAFHCPPSDLPPQHEASPILLRRGG